MEKSYDEDLATAYDKRIVATRQWRADVKARAISNVENPKRQRVQPQPSIFQEDKEDAGWGLGG